MNNRVKACGAAASCVFITLAAAETPSPIQAKQAIENRKAVFTLIGNNFKPVGEILKGTVAYQAVDVGKLTARVSFLTGLLPDAFPDVSQTGDTQAKSEIWSNRTDFDRRLSEFAQHAAALSQVVGQHGGNSDAFQAAVRAVVQDCKGCHDNYRNK